MPKEVCKRCGRTIEGEHPDNLCTDTILMDHRRAIDSLMRRCANTETALGKVLNHLVESEKKNSHSVIIPRA